MRSAVSAGKGMEVEVQPKCGLHGDRTSMLKQIVFFPFSQISSNWL